MIELKETPTEIRIKLECCRCYKGKKHILLTVMNAKVYCLPCLFEVFPRYKKQVMFYCEWLSKQERAA